MTVESLDHYAIRTEKLRETRDFFVDILGFVDGARPNFTFPGHWLYVDGAPAVHLIGVGAADPGAADHLDRDLPSDSTGAGAIDHVAFRAHDPMGFAARLKARGIPFEERDVPGMDLHQIFVTDPNGITIELNYFGGA